MKPLILTSLLLLLPTTLKAENRSWGWDFNIVGVNAEGPMEVGSEMTLKVTVENNSYTSCGTYGTVVVVLEITPPSGSTTRQEKKLYDIVRKDWKTSAFNFTPSKEGTHKVKITVLNPDKDHTYDEETNSFYVDKKEELFEAPEITRVMLVSDDEKIRVSYTHPGAMHYLVSWEGCGASDEGAARGSLYYKEFFTESFPPACRVKFKAKAYDGDEYSAWSTPYYFTTPTPSVPPPAIPSGIAYSRVDQQTIRVSIGTVAGATRYKLEQTCDNEIVSINDHNSPVNDYPERSCTTRSFRAAAVGEGGTSPWSASIPVVLQDPGTPDNPEPGETIEERQADEWEAYYLLSSVALLHSSAVSGKISQNINTALFMDSFKSEKWEVYNKNPTLITTREIPVYQESNILVKIRGWQDMVSTKFYGELIFEDSAKKIRAHITKGRYIHIEQLKQLPNGHHIKIIENVDLLANGRPMIVKLANSDGIGLAVTEFDLTDPRIRKLVLEGNEAAGKFEIQFFPRPSAKTTGLHNSLEGMVTASRAYVSEVRVKPVISGIKAAKVFKYLKNGGKLVMIAGTVVSAYTILSELAEGDYDAVTAELAGQAGAWSAFTVVAQAGTVTCSYFIPAGGWPALVCELGTVAVALVAAYHAYEMTKEATIEIQTKYGNLLFTPELKAEIDRLRKEYPEFTKLFAEVEVQGTETPHITVSNAPAAGSMGEYTVVSPQVNLAWDGASPRPAAVGGREVQLKVSLTSPDIGPVILGRLTGDTWAPAPATITKASEKASIKGTLDSGTYALFSKFTTSASSLDSTVVFPNPFRPTLGHTLLNFGNLPAGAKVTLYTLQGALVKRLPEPVNGNISWDTKNTDGTPVVSGVYIYSIRAGGELKNGKLAIIR